MQACAHTPIWSGERLLRTNARGRHTCLLEFKRRMVEQARQPGMSLAGLAMSSRVNANQLRRWVQLHGEPCEAAACVPASWAMAATDAPGTRLRSTSASLNTSV
jgi:transposase-like protein